MATLSSPPETPQTRTVRELPPEEWYKLRAVMPQGFDGLPNPGRSRVAVVEEGGEIRGFWFVFATIHVEPLWIHEDLRANAGIVRRMWGTIREILHNMWEGTGGLFGDVAFAIINDDDLPRKLPMAKRLGFVKVPGSLYFIVPQRPPEGGGDA